MTLFNAVAIASTFAICLLFYFAWTANDGSALWLLLAAPFVIGLRWIWKRAH